MATILYIAMLKRFKKMGHNFHIDACNSSYPYMQQIKKVKLYLDSHYVKTDRGVTFCSLFIFKVALLDVIQPLVKLLSCAPFVFFSVRFIFGHINAFRLIMRGLRDHCHHFWLVFTRFFNFTCVKLNLT